MLLLAMKPGWRRLKRVERCGTLAWLMLVALLSCLATSLAVGAEKPAPPNVVLILADDK